MPSTQAGAWLRIGRKALPALLAVASGVAGGAAGGQSVSWWQQQHVAATDAKIADVWSEVRNLRDYVNQNQREASTKGETVAAVNATVKLAIEDLREIRREFREGLRARR